MPRKKVPYQPRPSRWKPRGFEDYYTIRDLSRAVDKGEPWLMKLERESRIPQANRVQFGTLKIRLWSPRQVEEIRAILATHRVGRPAQ